MKSLYGQQRTNKVTKTFVSLAGNKTLERSSNFSRTVVDFETKPERRERDCSGGCEWASCCQSCSPRFHSEANSGSRYFFGKNNRVLQKPVVFADEKTDPHTTHTPPVTFSPSVVDPATTNRKQGILKKRRSLDESTVMRHRSCSPDVANKASDFRYRDIFFYKNSHFSPVAIKI